VWAVLAGRLTSVLTSTLTVLVTYRIGLLVRGAASGLVAAGMVALSGLLVQLAHFATPDSTTILFMSLALLAAVRCAQAPTRQAFVLAGAFAGLAMGSEYHMVILVVPLLGAWMLSGRRAWPLLGVAALAMAAAWIAVNPYAVLQSGAFLGANVHSLQVRTVDSGAEYQDRWSPYGPAILYVLRYPLGYGVGFLLAIWLVAGAIWGAVRRDRATLVLLLWILPYFVLVTLSPAKFMRYSAPLLPPLAVLAGAFLVDVTVAARPGVRVVVLAAAAASAIYTFVYDGAYASLFASPDPRQVVTTWLEEHAAPRAAIGFEEIPNGLLNLPYFVTNAGFRPCFSSFQPANLDSRAQYFVLDNYALEEHPDVALSSVDRFRRSLQSDPQYREVLRLQPEPSWLGMTFAIDGSPHDWRYPARSIIVYRHMSTAGASVGQCFSTLAAAQQALYVPPATGSG
jgi:hypothetical protein